MCLIIIIALIIGLAIFFLVFGLEVYEGYKITIAGKNMLTKGAEAFSNAQNGDIDYSSIGSEALKALW